MRLVPVQMLKEGMKLGKKIYSADGVTLLAEGVELTNNLIRRLKGISIDYVYIQDLLTEDIVIPEVLHEETRRKALYTIQSSFKKISESTATGNSIGGYRHLGKDFSNVMQSILDDLNSQEVTMIMLMDMNLTDHYLYRHSLNVCIYTLILGAASGLSYEQLKVLGIGSLLHDIGKTQIPIKILMKPERLDEKEFEQIKSHTELGFKILKDEPGIPLLAAHCALQHHERLNGTGYPRGLKGSEIHEFAQWLGMADSYDAMTSHRVYKQAMLPHQAMDLLYGGSGILFDQMKLQVFRDKVAIYPPGMSVKLSSGETGVVSRIHPSIPQRPVVRILTNEYGEALKAPYDMDLTLSLSIVITQVEGLDTFPEATIQ
ncbi:HD-GYP domain-containing protein [Paenibacillus glacialis]|uniref:Histidine kinase n=1 Tax=Paenibacillus glacialis TaxID=494026 RepID=A0A162KB86_9BACL|nr:HD-GYP domain-containing protein [Paenibacillus glacialis]OAB43228.1 histidine kinase [Paenibacillus glacialis]